MEESMGSENRGYWAEETQDGQRRKGREWEEEHLRREKEMSHKVASGHQGSWNPMGCSGL